MFVSVLLNETSELLKLCIQAVHDDLKSGNDVNQCLALCLIGNLGNKDFAEALYGDVQKLLFGQMG